MRNPIALSKLGFGCASVMGKIGRAQALRSMATAYDLGVTHFDVARSYGFGRAESVLGHFIKGRRDKVTITTKFGVVPPVLKMSSRVAIPTARLASQFFPQLKERLKKKSRELLYEHNFDVDYARKCLNLSLTELSTDYIDIYLIHEPDLSALKNPDELSLFLDHAVIEGKIRRWGIAYKSAKDYVSESSLKGDIIQFEGNFQTLPLCSEILSDQRQRIVTRPFIGGYGINSIDNILKNTEKFQGIGVSSSDISLHLALELAGEFGSVVCSMFNSAHIEENINKVNSLIGMRGNNNKYRNLFTEINKSNK